MINISMDNGAQIVVGKHFAGDEPKSVLLPTVLILFIINHLSSHNKTIIRREINKVDFYY